jgi:hypothetical protein
MATCAECQAEVNDLAVLPGLLGRLDEPTVVAAAEMPPPTLVTGAVRRVRKQRRGRRILAGAAVLAVACLALVIGLVMPQIGGTTAHPATPVALHAMQSVNSNTLVTAQIGLTPITGGTQIEVKCQYAWPAGANWSGKQQFFLFVYPRSGAAPEQVSFWSAGPGTSVQIPAMSGWTEPHMARVELRDSKGQPLLVYNLA